MDLLTVVQIVLRRWLVWVPVLIATIVVAVAVDRTIPPAYEAQGSVLLARPELDPSRFPQAATYLAGSLERIDAGRLGGSSSELTVNPIDRSVVEFVAVANTESTAVSAVGRAVTWLREDIESAQTEATVPESERLIVRENAAGIGVTDLADGRLSASLVVELIDPTAGASNPFNASEATGRVIEVAVESDAGQLRFEELAGPGIGYRISQATRDAAPIMTITTTGADAQAVLAAFDQVRGLLDEELDRRQARAQVPLRQRVTVEVLAEPQRIEDVSPPLSRAVAGVVALGGLLALGLSLLVDGIAQRRATRRAARVEAEPATTASTTTEQAGATPPGEPAQRVTGPTPLPPGAAQVHDPDGPDPLTGGDVSSFPGWIRSGS